MQFSEMRFSEEASRKLSQMKGRTGLTPNVLARIGFCISLESPVKPNPVDYDGTGYLSIKRHVLTGSYDTFFLALLKERCFQDGLPETELLDQFKAHMNRGVLLLDKRLKSLNSLLSLIPDEWRQTEMTTVPARAPGDDVPAKAASDDVPAGAPGDDVPAGASGDDVPAGAPGDDVPAGVSGDDVPAGATGDDVPAGATGDDVPAGTASGDVPAGTASDDVPAGTASGDVPAGTASGDVPAGAPGDDVPAGTMLMQTRAKQLRLSL